MRHQNEDENHPKRNTLLREFKAALLTNIILSGPLAKFFLTGLLVSGGSVAIHTVLSENEEDTRVQIRRNLGNGSGGFLLVEEKKSNDKVRNEPNGQVDKNTEIKFAQQRQVDEKSDNKKSSEKKKMTALEKLKRKIFEDLKRGLVVEDDISDISCDLSEKERGDFIKKVFEIIDGNKKLYEKLSIAIASSIFFEKAYKNYLSGGSTDKEVFLKMLTERADNGRVDELFYPFLSSQEAEGIFLKTLDFLEKNGGALSLSLRSFLENLEKNPSLYPGAESVLRGVKDEIKTLLIEELKESLKRNIEELIKESYLEKNTAELKEIINNLFSLLQSLGVDRKEYEKLQEEFAHSAVALKNTLRGIEELLLDISAQIGDKDLNIQKLKRLVFEKREMIISLDSQYLQRPHRRWLNYIIRQIAKAENGEEIQVHSLESFVRKFGKKE